MNILVVGMSCTNGGIENYVMNNVRLIDKEKFRFDFINMFDSLAFEKEIIHFGGCIHKVKNVKKNPLKYFCETYAVIKQKNYAVVHVHMLSAANILPVIAARILGVKKIIAHSHNSDIPKGIMKKILNITNRKILLKCATDYWACSEKAGKWLFGAKIVKSQKYKTMHNAVDLKKFKFDIEKRNYIRNILNVKNQLVVGHVGRFSRQKNHEFLVEIFREICEFNAQTVLLLIGSGELEVLIREKIKEFGLENNVIFISNKNDIADYYQAMDIFILPSLFEGLPIVGIEAQANGLQCFFSSEITLELKLSEYAKFIDLDTGCKEWARIIMNSYKENNREIDTEYFGRKGYSLKKEVKKLEKNYEEK